MLSVNSFLEIYELVDEFVSKETETFKFRFLMQSLYDEKFRKDLLQMPKSVQASDTPDAIEEKFMHMRNLCVKELKKAENAAKEEKRMDYMLRALAYFCLLETFNENSSFSE